MSTDITGTECPECGYQFELASQVDGENVQPGSNDVTICVNCGAVAVFSVDDHGVLGIRKPEHAELVEIYRDYPQILDIQRDLHHALQMALHPSRLK